MKEVIKMSNEEYLKLLKEHDELVAEHCPKCGGDDFNTIAILDYESEILMVECTNCLWAGTTEELVKGKVIKMKEDYAKALKEFNEIKNAEENEMAKAKAVVVDKVRFLGELYGQRKAQALKQLRLVEDVIMHVLRTQYGPTTAHATASKSNVLNSRMHARLMEFAETRATARALRLYTGYGGTSYEELPDAEIEVE